MNTSQVFLNQHTYNYGKSGRKDSLVALFWKWNCNTHINQAGFNLDLLSKFNEM